VIPTTVADMRSTGVALAFAVLLMAAGCAPPGDEDPLAAGGTSLAPVTTATSTSTSTTSSTTTTTVVVPTTTAPTTTAPLPTDVLAGLAIADEHLPGYDRDLFKHWSDFDHDGCNTRCEVLEAERRPDFGWVSIYDGFVTNDPTKLEVDHVVALAEAWRSGAWAWDNGRREAFANDLDEPDALIAVSSSSNQSKADKDPAEWRPSARGSWCQWAKGWLRVKVKWGLSADQREADALRSILADC
jgi:hypothetical protein